MVRNIHLLLLALLLIPSYAAGDTINGLLCKSIDHATVSVRASRYGFSDVELSDTSAVVEGETVKVTVKPEAGYQFIDQTATPWSKDITISSQLLDDYGRYDITGFLPRTYRFFPLRMQLDHATVTATTQRDGTTMTLSDGDAAYIGEKLAVTVTPDAGYCFDDRTCTAKTIEVTVDKSMTTCEGVVRLDKESTSTYKYVNSNPDGIPWTFLSESNVYPYAERTQGWMTTVTVEDNDDPLSYDFRQIYIDVPVGGYLCFEYGSTNYINPWTKDCSGIICMYGYVTDNKINFAGSHSYTCTIDLFNLDATKTDTINYYYSGRETIFSADSVEVTKGMRFTYRVQSIKYNLTHADSINVYLGSMRILVNDTIDITSLLPSNLLEGYSVGSIPKSRKVAVVYTAKPVNSQGDDAVVLSDNQAVLKDETLIATLTLQGDCYWDDLGDSEKNNTLQKEKTLVESDDDITEVSSYVEDRISHAVCPHTKVKKDGCSCELCGEIITPTDGTYLICDAEDLVNFSNLVNHSGLDDVFKAKLTADIDVSERSDFRPIGDWSGANKTFRGTFDGDGHTVKLNLSGSNEVGLFGRVAVATIQNVTVDGSVEATGYYVGGIVGFSYYQATITNCHNKAKVKGDGDYVGGIVGFFYLQTSGRGITIDHCINYGDVAGQYYVGGIIGQMSIIKNEKNTIKYCANKGDVSASSNPHSIGCMYNGGGSGYSVSVSNCYNDNKADRAFFSAYNFTQSTPNLTVRDCYDINGSDETTIFAADDEQSGALCFWLNGKTVAEGGWYQRIGTDSGPVLTSESDERNLVNAGTLTPYGAESGTAAYFNSTEPVLNSDPTRFYILSDLTATPLATGNLKTNLTATAQNILVQDAGQWYCGYAHLADGTSYAVSTDYTAAQFVYDRQLASAGVYTFILPAAIGTADINGSVYKLTNYADGTLYFTDQTTTLDPNTPFLVKVEENGTQLIKGTLENVKVSKMVPQTITVANGTVNHIGSYKTQTGYGNDDGMSYYGYMNGEFVKVKATGTYTLNPFRTMITIDGSSAGAKLSTLDLDFSNGTTGIGGISTAEQVDVYNTKGMLVRTNVQRGTALQGLPNGVYIVNGKKMVKTNRE